MQARQNTALKALVTKLNSDSASSNSAPPKESEEARADHINRALISQSILQLACFYLAPQDLAKCVSTSLSAGHWCSSDGSTLRERRSVRERLRSLFIASTVHRFISATGSEMQPQFVPWYFGVAFAFLFKFCTGMPDMPDYAKHSRHRRTGLSSKVQLIL